MKWIYRLFGKKDTLSLPEVLQNTKIKLVDSKIIIPTESPEEHLQVIANYISYIITKDIGIRTEAIDTTIHPDSRDLNPETHPQYRIIWKDRRAGSNEEIPFINVNPEDTAIRIETSIYLENVLENAPRKKRDNIKNVMQLVYNTLLPNISKSSF
jgi:hypothetical protein